MLIKKCRFSQYFQGSIDFSTFSTPPTTTTPTNNIIHSFNSSRLQRTKKGKQDEIYGFKIHLN